MVASAIIKARIAYSRSAVRRLGTGTTTTSSRSSDCCPTTRSTPRTPSGLAPALLHAACRALVPCRALRVVWSQPLGRPWCPPQGLALPVDCPQCKPRGRVNACSKSLPRAGIFSPRADAGESRRRRGRVPAQMWAGPGACGASPHADVRRRSPEASTYYGDDVLVHYSDWSQQGAPCCARAGR